MLFGVHALQKHESQSNLRVKNNPYVYAGYGLCACKNMRVVLTKLGHRHCNLRIKTSLMFLCMQAMVMCMHAYTIPWPHCKNMRDVLNQCGYVPQLQILRMKKQPSCFCSVHCSWDGWVQDYCSTVLHSCAIHPMSNT